MNKANSISGKRGMVVSGHPDATQAAWRILEAGGSVSDAAIAGAAALAVTLPMACTLAGDAFILVHDAARGKTFGLNASGPSPALAVPSLFADGIEERGARSCTVPGVVGGWQALHDRFGRLSWRELIEPSIALARDGFAVSPGMARATEVYARLIDADPGSRALFRADGAPLRAGETFRQPALARTLELLAAEGAPAFYEGGIAASLARACEARGGLLRKEDFSGYAPVWAEPIATRYRGHEVRVMPPNSYGLYLLLQLMALDEAPREQAPLDSPQRIARLVRAAQAAFTVGAKAVADPDFDPEPAADLLGEAGRARLRAAQATPQPNLGGTAIISVADAAGNAVTIVQSVFLVFGSGVSDPDTGLLLNNRMIGFTTEQGHPNQVAPRKRPAHTLCPAMVFRDGRLRYALGTPGGPGQTITLAQVIEALLELGASLDEAVSTPRWSMDLGSAAVAEDSMPQQTIDGARALGIDLRRANPDSPFFGSAEAIELRDDGTLLGVADFRRDAAAHGA